MKTTKLPQSAWSDSKAAGSQSQQNSPSNAHYLTSNVMQPTGFASNDAHYEHESSYLLTSHHLVTHDKASAVNTEKAKGKSTIDSGYKKASKCCKASPVMAHKLDDCLQRSLDTTSQNSDDNSRNQNSRSKKIDLKEYEFEPTKKSNPCHSIEIPERVFMNGLIKHTAIALAIIVPLAAFSAYAAPQLTPMNATSTATTDKTTTATLAIDPSAIIHKSASMPTTVDSVDLEQYAGKWYEIGRLPMYFQRNCARDVTATYTGKTDGSGITVLNQCTGEDGKAITAEGLAKAADSTGSKLKVTFLPSWIRWVPVGRADYWVLARDADYKTALVGTPDHKYLWLLARSPNISQQTYAKYRQIAQQQGYDLKEFKLTTQTNQTVKLVH